MVSIALNFAARSDVGLVRRSNQDSGYAGPHLLVLADGMGGPAGGDIASSVAVAHLVPLDDELHGADDLLVRLRNAISAAHSDLVERSDSDPELAGLGTTCIAMLRAGSKMAMVHIGDSRAYVVRDGALTQVTTDHTLVQHLVETGRLTPEEAERHPQRSVLLRVLGDSDAEVVLDESVRELRPGDRWLLCSDGLSGVVSAETIEQALTEVDDPGECADELLSLALRGGGPDNITCVVADVLDADALPDGAGPSTTPHVVGAAATDRLRRSRGSSGAAGRAAALAAAQEAAEVPEDDDTTSPRSLRRRVRRTLLTLLLAVLLLGGGWWGYSWTQTQYYIAPAGQYVGIYQGIPQEIGPLSFSVLHEATDVRLDDLPTYAQRRIEGTITVSSLVDAERRVADLRQETGEPTDETTDEPAEDPTTEPPSPSPSGTASPDATGAGD